MKFWLARNKKTAGIFERDDYVLSTSRLRCGTLRVWHARTGREDHFTASWWHTHDPDMELRLKPGEGPVQVTMERVADETSN